MKFFQKSAVISPLLANIYLHYVLDQWVDQWRRTKATGDVIIVRYADDFVMGFQHRHEAEGFLSALKQWLEKFSLDLHPDKTRLIELSGLLRKTEGRKERAKPKHSTFWDSSTFAQ